MNVSKVVPSILPVYNNKNRHLTIHSEQDKGTSASNSTQESYHYSNADFERIQKTDLTLYDEIQSSEQKKEINKLFYLSIHV